MFVGEKGREKKREEKRERREREKEEEEENEVKKEARTESKRESPLPPLPPVLMSSTPPCVDSKRLCVKRQDARMLNTCGRLAATHGGVLNQHTEACWT